MTFDAFISYSHGADTHRATALQRALQNLARPFYRWKALNVFRDTTSLTANPALWPSIEKALRQSRFFIFLACPESVASAWCTREIEWWLTNRGPDSFLIVLTGGQLAFDESRQDFDWAATTALPRCVAGRFSAEPLYRDLRWVEEPDSSTLDNPRFRAEVLPLAAALHGKEPAELDSEDLRQFKRARFFRRCAITGLIALTISSAVAAWVAKSQRDEAIRQRNVAVARQLAVKAQFLEAEKPNLLRQSVLLAMESLARSRSFEADQVIRSGLELLPAQIAEQRYEPYLSAQGLTAIHGERIAFFTASGELQVVDTVGDAPANVANWQMDRRMTALAFGPRGERLAIGARDGTVFLWNLNEPQPRLLTAGDREISALAIGTAVVAVAPNNKPVQIISFESGQSVELGNQSKGVIGMSFSRDGKKLGAARADGALIVWQTDTWDELCRSSGDYPGQIFASSLVAFSVEGDLVVKATPWDKSLAVRNTTNGAALAKLEHRDLVLSVEFSNRGDWVATASADGRARVFDARTGGLVAELQHGGPVRSVRFAQRDPYDSFAVLVTASEDGTARVFELEGGRELMRATHDSSVGIALPRLGYANRIATLGYDGTLRLWKDAGTGPLLVEGELVPPAAAAWSVPRDLFAIAYPHGHVHELDPARKRGGRFLGGTNWDVETEKFSTDGGRVLMAGRSRAQVWNLTDGATLWDRSMEGVASWVLSPDGDSLVVLDSSNVVRRFDVAYGRELARMLVSDYSYGDRLVADRDYVALAGLRGLRIHRLGEGDNGPPLVMSKERVNDMAFSADGKFLVWSGERTVLLDLASGHEIPLQGREDFKWGGMVVFSTDTRFVAVSVRDRLGVWDVPAGHLVLDDRLESEITVISFSPEGETIAAGGKNGATDIWQLSDGQRIARVMVVAAAGRQSVPPVTAAALSPHGEYLLTTTRGATRIWAVSVESLTRQVSARIAGDLTTAEWKAFAGDERRLTSIHPTR